jgi:hypothetical protein
MKQLVKAVPDAGSYAPVTILIDKRRDGVHISYDRMASYLAPYGNAEALKVARDLDAKAEGLLTAHGEIVFSEVRFPFAFSGRRTYASGHVVFWAAKERAL